MALAIAFTLIAVLLLVGAAEVARQIQRESAVTRVAQALPDPLEGLRDRYVAGELEVEEFEAGVERVLRRVRG